MDGETRQRVAYRRRDAGKVQIALRERDGDPGLTEAAMHRKRQLAGQRSYPFMRLVGPGAQRGVEDLLRLEDLRAGLSAYRLFIRPLAS